MSKPILEMLRRHLEECQCDQCGFPMYVGERVWRVDYGINLCSIPCIEEHDKEQRAKREQAKPKGR